MLMQAVRWMTKIRLLLRGLSSVMMCDDGPQFCTKLRQRNDNGNRQQATDETSTTTTSATTMEESGGGGVGGVGGGETTKKEQVLLLVRDVSSYSSTLLTLW
jgi:hypothetical protein